MPDPGFDMNGGGGGGGGGGILAPSDCNGSECDVDDIATSLLKHF